MYGLSTEIDPVTETAPYNTMRLMYRLNTEIDPLIETATNNRMCLMVQKIQYLI